jgi:hypothetical protein
MNAPTYPELAELASVLNLDAPVGFRVAFAGSSDIWWGCESAGDEEHA